MGDDEEVPRIHRHPEMIDLSTGVFDGHRDFVEPVHGCRSSNHKNDLGAVIPRLIEAGGNARHVMGNNPAAGQG